MSICAAFTAVGGRLYSSAASNVPRLLDTLPSMVVGEFTTETDLAVVGGGPGGYSAAIRAAELGVPTVLIDERSDLGGRWLHEGCIISKELVHLTGLIRGARHAASFGVSFAEPSIDLDRLRERLHATVQAQAVDLRDSCLEHGVTIVSGRARFENSRQLTIENQEMPRVRFRRAVIATGTRDAVPHGIVRDLEGLMFAREALRLEEIPKTLLVVGGSTCAVELAQVYATLGSRVTLIEAADRLIPSADADLVEIVASTMSMVLAAVHLGTRVSAVEREAGGLRVTLECDKGESPSPQCFEGVLVAAGREADVGSLELGRTSVQLSENGFIITDEQMRTSDPRIFAIGDVTGEPMLALKAAQQGRVVAEVAAGWSSRYEPAAVPMVVFCEPRLAWCGLTEQRASAEGIAIEVHHSRWSGSDQTTALHRGSGFTKIICDPDAQLILGVGIVGAGAGELIAEAALAIEMGAVLMDLAETIHPHPTASERLADAARGAQWAIGRPPMAFRDSPK